MPELAVHAALLTTQFCWGSAAVVNKLGLSGIGVSPLLYAFVREAMATPILCVLLLVGVHREKGQQRLDAAAAQSSSEGIEEANNERQMPKWKMLLLRGLPGFFIFVDQLGSLSGNAFAGPLATAAWQPSQVVMTLALCVLMGVEELNVWNSLSMVFTVGGALCLVLLGGRDEDVKGRDSRKYYIGQAFLFGNCLASSLEVIIWRYLLSDSRSNSAHLRVMAESYLIAAICMSIACSLSSLSPASVDFFCPECGGNAWRLPVRTLWPIAYSVLIQTIAGYLLLAWALKNAQASTAALYSTAQPVMSIVVTCALLWMNINPHHVLEWPSQEVIGAVLIVAGLLMSEIGPRLSSYLSLSAGTRPEGCE